MKKLFCIFVVEFVSVFAIAQSLGELAGAGTSLEAKTSNTTSVEAKNTSVAKDASTTSNDDAQEKFDAIFLKASQGDANAQLALGALYARGVKPVSPNAQLALEWLEKSANQGNVAAMNYIGVIYGDGKLIKQDFSKAIHWRELAAEKGSPVDKFALANSFIYGYMLPANQDKAMYWLQKAGEAGHMDAINQLVSIYSNRGDKQQAKHWKNQRSFAQISAARAGDVSAMYEVYRKYISGKGGLSRSIPKGLYWLRKASDAGHILAIDTLAMMYVNGRYVERDFNKGIAMLEKLASKNPAYALKISTLYSEDVDNSDLAKAEQWLDVAAKNLGGLDKIRIIWKFWAGFGVKKNLQKAIAYCDEMLKSANEKNTKDIVEKIKADILANKDAPENIWSIVNK